MVSISFVIAPVIGSSNFIITNFTQVIKHRFRTKNWNWDWKQPDISSRPKNRKPIINLENVRVVATGVNFRSIVSSHGIMIRTSFCSSIHFQLLIVIILSDCKSYRIPPFRLAHNQFTWMIISYPIQFIPIHFHSVLHWWTIVYLYVYVMTLFLRKSNGSQMEMY